MSGLCDIRGVDKIELLRVLWKWQEPPGFRFKRWDDEAAAKAVKGPIDYFGGVAIKSDLSGDFAETALYDRDNILGKGAFQKYVEELKQKQ